MGSEYSHYRWIPAFARMTVGGGVLSPMHIRIYANLQPFLRQAQDNRAQGERC